ncbi:MAG TPA: hypothetical protein VL359_09630 [bacterium]|nr:hypothetical protein [bacterium]
MPKPSGPRAKGSASSSGNSGRSNKAGKRARASASGQTEISLLASADDGTVEVATAGDGKPAGGNGVATGGMEAQDAATPLAQVGASGTAPVPAPLSGLRELALTSEGCWQVEADGQRKELTEAQWRHELAKMLRKAPPG